METNILGLPSFTGYTPLKAFQKGQVLKFDFREIGPIAIDKSGHGNSGRLKPRENPPRRKVVSWFPLEVALDITAGEKDHVEVPTSRSIDRAFSGNKFTALLDVEIREQTEHYNQLITVRSPTGPNHFIELRRMGQQGIIFALTGTNGEHPDVRARNVWSPQERVEIRGVYDGSEMSLYVDGEEVVSDSVSMTLAGVAEKPVEIGMRHGYVGMRLYKVSLYDKAVPP